MILVTELVTLGESKRIMYALFARKTGRLET